MISHASKFPTLGLCCSPVCLPSLCMQQLQPPWSLCFQRAEPKPDLYAIRDEPFPSGHLSPLTDTDSLRHSRALGAPLLFRPTRKRPRQATPPSRHREQQHRERDENPIINPTALSESGRERGGKSRVVTITDEEWPKLDEIVRIRHTYKILWMNLDKCF